MWDKLGLLIPNSSPVEPYLSIVIKAPHHLSCMMKTLPAKFNCTYQNEQKMFRYSIWYPGLFHMFHYCIFLLTTRYGIPCMWLHCHYYVLPMNVCLLFIPIDTTTHLSSFAHVLRCKSYFIFTYCLLYWLYHSLPLLYLGTVSILVHLPMSWGLTSVILSCFCLPPLSFTALKRIWAPPKSLQIPWPSRSPVSQSLLPMAQTGWLTRIASSMQSRPRVSVDIS